MVNHGKTVIAREIEQEKQITEKNDEDGSLSPVDDKCGWWNWRTATKIHQWIIPMNFLQECF